MKSTLRLILLTVGIAISAHAQVFVLDNFNTGTVTGMLDPTTSWNGDITQNATTLTVGGTAQDDNGWAHTFGSLTDLSAYSFISITAQRDVGNVAANLSLTLADDNGSDFTTITINTSNFALGSMTTYVVGFAWTGAGVEIASWNFGGGQAIPGSAAFRMTFDNLALSTTGAPIPEPSTYAAIAGLLALGFVAYRRRQLVA